ncbi:MAG: magnesium chelatase subunit H [Proteobacteria bacterium]|nr:magnesium chelatase subunit H [Pseudomonadota bacterium]
MPKRTSAADATPIRVVIVTMDSHLSGVIVRARQSLKAELPGIDLAIHAADEWGNDQAALDRCLADIARGDIVIATMLFLDEHIRAVLPALAARRDSCDAMVCCMSAGEVVRLTRLGKFSMSGEAIGALSWLKRLRGNRNGAGSSGRGQMKMLRQLPRLLRFLPGKAQDLRAYFLTLQYWLAGSEANVANMVRLLVERYAEGPRLGLRARVKAGTPAEYPDVGIYHPAIRNRISGRLEDLPPAGRDHRGTVGVLVMRSYLLAGNTGHYDGVIAALEARGLRVVTAFASGLDVRPAVERYFMAGGRPSIDALVSLTGFSLVGGPAYNDARSAEEMLAGLDVPYLAAHPLEFQTIEQWEAAERGLTPVEATIMVAIPELDGATGPMVFGGRTAGRPGESSHEMRVHPERADMLAARVARLVALRRTPRAERKVAITLFSFPPNAGNIGTAQHLAVFESLHRTLATLKAEGYAVDLPADVDALRRALLEGNAPRFGTVANVHARIAAGDHVRRERHLREIEQQWGAAPGKHQTDGTSLFVLGERFGNVFVGVQPAFGYEGDPMRLLFDRGFAPTHAFSAFYRWIREDFGANAVLHFGTHGALEFMPGKQVGLSSACWPDRLIGDLPNFYLYAANNPSEGTIAKRRSAATLISYLTPPVAQAGLYAGLVDLRASVDRWRGLPPDAEAERAALEPLIQGQAATLDLVAAEPAWGADAAAAVAALVTRLAELEATLIPQGLHVIGKPDPAEQRVDTLLSVAEATHGQRPDRATVEAVVAGVSPDKAAPAAASERDRAVLRELAAIDAQLKQDHETPAIVRALDGAYLRPTPGGDLLRTPSILPTGRNVHGFDPFRIPSVFAVEDGARQATRLLEAHAAAAEPFPESVAMVLWATDNLKSEGAQIGQALALLGAAPRFDSFGRLAGATLKPLAELGRPRIDVVVTLSGIFRDLLPLQTKLLAEAAFLAASADEPVELNFVRKHTLDYQTKHRCDLETAALRVFGNAEGAYGSNVNQLVESGRWETEDELADMFASRKGFAYDRNGRPAKQSALLQSMLGDVSLAYQNLESVELGVTSIDHYFDTLGGISRAVRRARDGQQTPVYIGDQTRGEGAVRTLSEQVAIEARTRLLNPKWYEAILEHGYEGVHQIEAHVTNTMGWSATTGHVAPWVYQQLTQTFMLDPEMRDRLARLNPTASARVANRLLEASDRHYWTPDEDVLDALRRAGAELEDRLEGVFEEAAA